MMNMIPVVAHITAFGHRYGDAFLAPDTDRTWRLIGTGDWVLDEDPWAWGDPMSTMVDAPEPETVPVAEPSLDEPAPWEDIDTLLKPKPRKRAAKKKADD